MDGGVKGPDRLGWDSAGGWHVHSNRRVKLRGVESPGLES